jgi:formylglycine-generating enzyme required for sulfatase activity/serine/threonine protein kinase
MSADSRRDTLGITGTVIADKYRIGPVIGEGGFSAVYRAEHMIWQQPVAIKCFKILANAPEDQREQLLDGFIQEGKLMAQLSSRSAAIVQARDIGTFNSKDGQWVPYMVLEWLDGKPLDQVLWEERRAGLPARSLHEAFALLEPAAQALEVAHQQGVAHRDVKPANFFVIGNARSPQVYVKVLDFGIAKVMAEHAAAAAALAHTGTEITSFTPNYGAPEQFSRTYGATGPWTDVFAMALILVEVLRGGLPAFEGAEFMQMQVESRDPQRRPTPRTFGVPVTDAVEQVFLKALAVAPGDRFASMGQLWSALMHAVFPDAPTWSAGTSGGVSSMRTPSPATGPGPSPVTFRGPGQLGVSQLGPSQPTGPVPVSPASHPMGFAPTQTPSGVTSPTSAPMLGSAVPTAAVPVPAAKRSSGGMIALVVGLVALGVAGAGVAAYKFAGAGPAAATSASASAAVAARPPASASAAPPASAARPTTCPEGMVLVPGGKFFMGSDEPGFKLWQPAHKVTLDTFCIDVHEVTAAEYKSCSDIGECKRPPPAPDFPKADNETEAEHTKLIDANAELCNFNKEGREKHPINCVSWALADNYCKWKKRRLPTEAEWEYAARGSDGRKYPWGDEPGDEKHMNACGTECNKWEVAHGLKPSPRMYNADDGWPGTAPVGSFPKGRTKFGADDFIGNVWEWTSDWFETYKPDEAVNPTGAPAGERKAIRGGGFNGGVALWLNPAFRYHQLATASAAAIGFRCAASL